MPRQIKRYGWIPDVPDQRDYLYAAPIQTLKDMPASIDLRSGCPGVYDQGKLGSCTANAIAGAIEFDQIKEQLAQVFVPSRLFIYYNERVIEGTVDSDSGAMIRDGIKSVQRKRVALRYRSVRGTTASTVLPRCTSRQSNTVSAHHTKSQHHEGTLSIRVSICVRVHCVREL